MYMIEITEDKFDDLVEHIGKSLKCMSKAMECLEEMKTFRHYSEDDYDDDDMRPRSKKYRMGGYDDQPTIRAGGRYGRY